MKQAVFRVARNDGRGRCPYMGGLNNTRHQKVGDVN